MFDCLSHKLIIANSNAYGFSLSELKLMQSYLSGRKQRTKKNQAYNSWEEIVFEVPEGSILSPILFKIDEQIVDLASYSDANTIYDAGGNIAEVIFSS